MRRTLVFFKATALLSLATALTHVSTLDAAEVVPTSKKEYESVVAPFLNNFCVDCHTGQNAEAEFRLDNIDPVVTSGQDNERWEKTLEMISIAAMPPEEAEVLPSKEERREVTAWITAELKKIGRGPDPARLSRPEFGNRVDNDELFSGQHTGPAYSPSRLWRKNPQIHARFENTLRLKGGSNPFAPKGGHGFQDYSLLIANEATIKAMRINASNYAAEILDGKLLSARDKDGKAIKGESVREGKSRYREFNDLLEASVEVDPENLQAAIKRSFELLLYRSPSVAELSRYEPFLKQALETADARLALEYLITAVVLSPEFVYRQEIGLGETLPDGRRILSPEEIAYALAYALTDSPPDEELRSAVRNGRLKTRADVEREARRMLSVSTKPYWSYEINHTFQSHLEACPNPRVLRFFREFFGYAGVFDVFKDQSRNADHKPQFIFKDADLFVLSILEEDKHVFERLLTSDEYVVHYVHPERGADKLRKIKEQIEKNKKQNSTKPDRVAEKLAKGLTPVLGGYRGGHYFRSYNLERDTWDYPLEQPFKLENRAGMLTHPAWLVAHSGNFDTDPIRRGKWIREHLLADVIPDIPIGVDAALEDNPHKTLREKLEKTTTAQCWRCHKKMNPLGLPFEEYDDFGRFREDFFFNKATGEHAGTHFEQEKAIKFSKQRKQPDVEFTKRDIDTRGMLSGTGDPKLDGPIQDTHDLMHRLAKSERVRQSFLRHAFRYWHGRNETLRDSPTLMAMEKAYLDNDGSFREVVVALLTSDSFLLRKDTP